MAPTPINVKRMSKERERLEKPNPDYFVHFKNDDVTSLDAYLLGAPDSLYSHKVLKFHIDIPSNYPFMPPKVKFIQHGSGRIHPNLYVDGKVCLSILGTWPGEPWSQAMGVETILVTIRSLLDNKPFTHEPSGRDDPAYNSWVQYCTWNLLLLDHLEKETEPAFQAFLNDHLLKNGLDILSTLKAQAAANISLKQVANKYGSTPTTTVNYGDLLARVTKLVDQAGSELARLSRQQSPEGEITSALKRLGNEMAASNGTSSPLKREPGDKTVGLPVETDRQCKEPKIRIQEVVDLT